MNRLLLGYSPDLDVFDKAPGAIADPGRLDREAMAFDVESTEQAAELLEVVDAAGLAALLGRMVTRAARASGQSLKKGVASELVGLLQAAARHALPAPNTLSAAGARAAPHRAGHFFDIELEGLSPEDQEFEAARRLVQLTNDAALQATQVPAHLTPAAAARLAALRAARRYAPGWLRPQASASGAMAARPPPLFAQAGRWVRRGPGVIELNH